MSTLRDIRYPPVAALALIALAASHPALLPAAEPYPLSTELAVLERDLTSADYRAVLATMIPTDLEAEWQRVATPDNYRGFADEHGGPDKLKADSALKAAYDRRKRIADGFLALMRGAYEKRKRSPPFEDAAALEAVLRSAATRAKGGELTARVAVRVLMPAEGAENQWPRLRGADGQGNASKAELPLHWGPDDNIAWKVSISGRGNSSPVVWGNRIFITAASADGSRRTLLCHARDDGRKLWEHDAPPAEARETLYHKNTFASSTPVTDGQRVIAFFGSAGLVCVDMQGRRQWHVDLGPFRTTHGPGASPVLCRDLVICVQYQNQDQTLFAAFDKQTGQKRWQHDQPGAMCWSTPVVLRVGDHDELVYNGSNHIAGYDPATGKEIWRVAGTSREAIPTVVTGGGLLFSASGRNGPTLAIRPGGRGDVTATHVVWRNLRGGPHVPSPLYHDRRLYIVNDTGIATCLDAATGKTVWQNRMRGRFSMSPVESGGRLLVTNEDGLSTILKAGDRFEVLAENDLGEAVLATPALVGGRLYFRSAEHLWCVGGRRGTD
jgi:outer membrane protein assembly factor BamB